MITKKSLSRFYFIIWFLFPFLSLSAQSNDSSLTSISTDFKGYWTTTTASNNPIHPDSSNNLLAFKFKGVTYSTGNNDSILNVKVGVNNYTPQLYKALPLANVEGNVNASYNTSIGLASAIDGDRSTLNYISPFPPIYIKDLLTDGANGLDLGTGIQNLEKGCHMSFSIKGVIAKNTTDKSPDLVFTQTADEKLPQSIFPPPQPESIDTCYFYDAYNNIVGREQFINWRNIPVLGRYDLDIYFTTLGVPCNSATISNGKVLNTYREIRMAAFLLTDFGITESNSSSIAGFRIKPCGASDPAFVAYNTRLITP